MFSVWRVFGFEIVDNRDFEVAKDEDWGPAGGPFCATILAQSYV